MKSVVRNGVTVFLADTEDQATEKTKELLYDFSDENTALFLSGGSTPKKLYTELALEKKLLVGAVVQVDERYGEPFHQVSNQLSIKNTGLLDYLAEKNIQFYPMLGSGKSREELAQEYEVIVSDLFGRFKKKIAILGIGQDGHTASIAPNRPDFNNPLFTSQKDRLVGEFKDPKPMSAEGSPVPPNGFGERITLTSKALSEMDQLLVLVLGQKKKEALEMVLTEGPVEKAPLRFCLWPKVSSKTLFITDQKV